MKNFLSMILAAVVVSAAAVSCNSASRPLPRGKASVAMDEAFASYLQAVADHKEDLHSVMVLQHGKVLEEKFFVPDTAHILNSVSKNYAGKGVKVSRVLEDHVNPQNMVYDPSHPDADENGYVMYPNVNIITEMTNLIDASRSYEANATAFEATKSMAQQGLQIGQGS